MIGWNYGLPPYQRENLHVEVEVAVCEPLVERTCRIVFLQFDWIAEPLDHQDPRNLGHDVVALPFVALEDETFAQVSARDRAEQRLVEPTRFVLPFLWQAEEVVSVLLARERRRLVSARERVIVCYGGAVRDALFGARVLAARPVQDREQRDREKGLQCTSTCTGELADR